METVSRWTQSVESLRWWRPRKFIYSAVQAPLVCSFGICVLQSFLVETVGGQQLKLRWLQSVCCSLLCPRRSVLVYHPPIHLHRIPSRIPSSRGLSFLSISVRGLQTLLGNLLQRLTFLSIKKVPGLRLEIWRPSYKRLSRLQGIPAGPGPGLFRCGPCLC